MIEHAALVVGAGPTGLMLAGEMALAGVDVAILERRANQDLQGLRAGGLHARTIEVLDQRGIAERFISQGQTYPVVHFHIPLNISDFPTRHNYVLGLRQNHIERILADWVHELDVPVYRETAVTGFSQDDNGVIVELSEGQARARYLIGCDGGRSVIRKAAGIEFAGSDPTMSWLIAEIEMQEEPKLGFHHDAIGTHAMSRLEHGSRIGVVLSERQLQRDSEPTLEELREALIGVYGTDFGIHSPTWLSRFTDMTRQAVSYRDRRVLLAGDAAHVHPPIGGQGLNLGVQDAMNLGWKLAQVLARRTSVSLLDTYHAERHPVAARVLSNTQALSALRRSDDRTKALGGVVAELLGMDEPRRRWAAEMSGLGIHYDLGRDDVEQCHPLLGRRMPDLELITDQGLLRVFSLLRDARPVLISFRELDLRDTSPWQDRVVSIRATYEGQWELPVIGPVTAPTAVLIRPDGYVAWVGETTHSGLTDALTLWFGP